MTAGDPRWSIGGVVRRSGVPASTLRYYEAIGVLPAADRLGGRRVYRPEILDSLAAIRTARAVGLSLEDIRELLASSGRARAGERLAALAERRLSELDALIADASRARAWMEAARGCRCRTLEDCRLFAEPCVS